MVLVLFVIMLLNVSQPEPRDSRLGFLRPFGVIAAVVLAIELAVVIVRWGMPPAQQAAGAAAGAAATATPIVRATPTAVATAAEGAGAGVASIGHTQLLAFDLFTKFLFPFEVTSILLLAAILGASVLARKRPEHS
jgi:NADH:ubiquinone oxidoreductase subunit 6 (subunit J)